MSSNPSTYNPMDLFKVWRDGSKFGSYNPRHLNFKPSFSVEEDTVNNFYTIGTQGPNLPFSYVIDTALDDTAQIRATRSDGVITDYATVGDSVSITTLFNNVFAYLAPTGGTTYVRRGKYMINTPIFPGKGAGANGSLSTYHVLKGEGRDNTIIQYDGTVPSANSTNMIMAKAPFELDGITVDGNNNTSKQLVQTLLPGNYIKLINNRFIPGNEIGVYIVGLWGFNLQNNIWYHSTTGFDQCAITQDEVLGANGFGFFAHNFMDKSLGYAPGSSLTSAGYKNVVISDNTIVRQAGNRIWGISLENWGTNYKNVVISNNNLVNCDIAIGGGTQGTQAVFNFDGIIFSKNNMEGGTYNVYGNNHTILAPSRCIICDGNVFRNSQAAAIRTESAGPVIISNNIIYDFNQSYSTSDGFRGAIEVYSKAQNADIYNNTIFMTDTTTNGSPYGIRESDNNTNIYIHHNRIVNTNGRLPMAINLGGTCSNIVVNDNVGWPTNLTGVSTFSGTGSQTAFVVTHGLSVTPTIPLITTNQTSHAYVSAIGSTTFTVTFITAPASGTNNVAIYWNASKTVFA